MKEVPFYRASHAGIMLLKLQLSKAKCWNNKRWWCSAYYSYLAYFRHNYLAEYEYTIRTE